MMRGLLILCLMAGVAAAQGFPALFDVSGVAPDDVLNVRAEPDPSAEIVGALAYDAKGVEVTAASGDWGRINLGERAGWASLSFLAAQTEGTLEQVAQFTCFGTEPFWALDVARGGPATFATPDGGNVALTAGAVRQVEGQLSRYGLWLGGPQVDGALTVDAAECSDGMSDRGYGLDARLMLGGAVSRNVSGCCSLQMD